MLIAIAPLLAAVVGLLIFVLAANPKLNKIGEHLMWTGMLVTLYVLANHVVRID